MHTLRVPFGAAHAGSRHDDGATSLARRSSPSPKYQRLRARDFMQSYIPLILAVVSTNALSQILLKHGMNTIGKFDFSGGSLLSMIPVVALNPFVIGGLAVLVFSMGLHLMALVD